MLKLGVNTVLFKKFSVREAMEAIKLAGYDGVELSAIGGMCEHLYLDDWKNSAPPIKTAAEELGLKLLSMEVASLDEERLTKAFAAAQYLSVPVVNVGPGGRSDNEDDLAASIATLNARAELAATYGVTLCCKAHVGSSIYSTPTTIEAAQKITSPAFGVDMDPSHIHRAGEKPEQALAQVANTIGLGEHLLLGHGEEQGSGRSRVSILADAVESVIAACYLDGGFEPAKAFIDRFVLCDVRKAKGGAKQYGTGKAN